MKRVNRPDGGHEQPDGPRCQRRPSARSRSKFRILKNHRAETRSEFHRLRYETPEFPRQRPGSGPLTYGNVGTSSSTRNDVSNSSRF
jgi:hypothetical protein